MPNPGFWFDPAGGGIGFNPGGGGVGGGGIGGGGGGLAYYIFCGNVSGQIGFVASTSPGGPGTDQPPAIAGPFATYNEMFAWANSHNPADYCQGGGGGGGGIEVCPVGTILFNGQCVPSPTLPGGGGGGTCPQCGCVTCQCGQSDQGRTCYQDPDGNYYWLGPNDDVPPDFTKCDQTQPTPPEQTPEEQPAQAIDNIQCNALLTYPWGSPDWCQCADQLRLAFEEWGASILNIISSETADPSEDQWNIIYRAFVLMDLYREMRQGSFAEIAPIWLSNLRRLYGWVTNIYGDNSAALFGIYACRSAIETALSLSGDISLADHFTIDLAAGIHGTGFGVSAGSQQTGSGGFSISAKMKLDQMLKVLDQLIQYYVPVGVLSHNDALSLYSANALTDSDLKCMFSAAGIHPDWAVPLAYAEREQPSAFEYVIAWRRGALDDQGLSDALRRRGWLSDDEKSLLVTISDFLPPPTDLVRFMLRNIGDPAIVQRFQLEAEFELLYVGKIVDWAKANGISEEVLRKYHAAHWDIPAPSWLSTFWQRFGEQRFSPAANALPNKMTAEDYNRALREQGIAPFWRPFFIAAQYSILGRRDLQYGYQYGALDETALRDGFLDAAFNPSQIDGLVITTKKRALKFWQSDPIVKGYIKNGVNEEALRGYLSEAGCPGALIDSVIGHVKIEATELANEQTIQLLEKAYETGGIDDLQLIQALNALMLDQDQIDRIALIVKQRKSARPKQIPATELCRWYGSRLISRSEFLVRLVSLGYTPLDAELIVAKCESDLSARQLRAEQLQLKAQATAERRRLKDLSQAERQAQLAKDRAAKALAAQIKAQRQADRLIQSEQAKEQAALDRAARRKELLTEQAERQELRTLANMEYIVDHWSKLTGLDSAALMPELQSGLAQATADNEVTVSELLAAIRALLASKPTDLPARLADLVSLALAQARSVPEPDHEPSTNGVTPSTGIHEG